MREIGNMIKSGECCSTGALRFERFGGCKIKLGECKQDSNDLITHALFLQQSYIVYSMCFLRSTTSVFNCVPLLSVYKVLCVG